MRQKFSLDYYNQHPDCKVETREGKPVRIICSDAKNGLKKIVTLIDHGDVESVFWYNETGLCKQTEQHPNDLFIVTEEPELTEFEQYVENLLNLADGEGHARPSIPKTKAVAKKFLYLARRQLVNDSYLIEKKAFHDASTKDSVTYQQGVMDGKEKALKDLPRWKKTEEEQACAIMPYIASANRLHNVATGYSISISDLEKLPKEE